MEFAPEDFDELLIPVLRLSRVSPEMRRFCQALAEIGELNLYQMKGETVVHWDDFADYCHPSAQPSTWDN
jgi:hypothetical protein